MNIHQSASSNVRQDDRLALWSERAMHMMKLRKAGTVTTAGFLIAHPSAKLGREGVYCILHVINLQFMNDTREDRFSASYISIITFTSLGEHFMHMFYQY